MTGHDPFPRPGRAGATHRLVVRGSSADRVGAENALAAAALATGDRAVLTVGTGLADHRPELIDRLERELRRRDDATGRAGADRGYVADLPGGSDAVLDALTVPAGEREAVGPYGEASWRAWEIRDLLVVAGDDWLAHLIPHESRAWVNADAAPALPEDLEEALEGSKAAMVPVGPLLTWGDGPDAAPGHAGPDAAHGEADPDPTHGEADPDPVPGQTGSDPAHGEADPDGLWADRVRLDGRTVDLARVERVGIDGRRTEAVFAVGAGEAGSGGIGSRVLRAGRRALDATGIREDLAGTHRVRFGDADALRTFEEALVEARDRLDYGFELVHLDRDAGGSPAGAGPGE